jgi:hypothetical protein
MKTYSSLSEITMYALWKIDKYSAVLEFNECNVEYFFEDDPRDRHSTYYVYYRF